MKSRFEVPIRNQDGLNSRSKVPRKRQKGSTRVKVAGRAKKRLYAKIDMKSEVSERSVIVDLPIRTVSEANNFEPWRVKYCRHKEQQRIVAIGLKPLRDKIKLPCKIVLTRFAPDFLDVFDNLPMSFKYIVDAVCAIITGEYRAGKADGDKRITLGCDQQKSEAYGIRIAIAW
jgi:hypothetical protein